MWAVVSTCTFICRHTLRDIVCCVDLCASQSCGDHGNCYAGRCYCKDGYTGTTCDNSPGVTTTILFHIYSREPPCLSHHPPYTMRIRIHHKHAPCPNYHARSLCMQLSAVLPPHILCPQTPVPRNTVVSTGDVSEVTVSARTFTLERIARSHRVILFPDSLTH